MALVNDSTPVSGGILAAVLAAAILAFGPDIPGGRAGTALQAQPPAPKRASAPPAEPRSAHGFPLHESLTLVCSQSVMMAPTKGGELHWSLYASSIAPDVIAAWYGERLPAANLERNAGGWIWRLPSAAAPRNVLSLYAPSHTGRPDCGKPPPADARALVNVSAIAR